MALLETPSAIAASTSSSRGVSRARSASLSSSNSLTSEAPPSSIGRSSLGKTARPLVRNDVKRAASGEADDDAHRPCRIGLCPCDPRRCRQRSSAGGQMQKSSAGEERESGVEGKRVDLGGGRIIKKKKKTEMMGGRGKLAGGSHTTHLGQNII